MTDTTLSHLKDQPITFEKGTNPGHPFRATHDGHELTIRLGDFPAEAMYTLIVDGEEGDEFDDWPTAWRRPAKKGLLAWLKTKAK